MPAIHYTPHALDCLRDREIEVTEVERTLTTPEKTEPGQDGRQIYMRRYFDKLLNQTMLLRVIVEETGDEFTVITLYKASRIERYLKGETK
jgi:hypothetical protein